MSSRVEIGWLAMQIAELTGVGEGRTGCKPGADGAEHKVADVAFGDQLASRSGLGYATENQHGSGAAIGSSTLRRDWS